MPKDTSPQHDSVASLVEQLRTQTEQVWDRQPGVDGEVTVFLINERDIPQAERMKSIGLAGGQGRSLSFVHRDGKGVLAEEGTWIA